MSFSWQTICENYETSRDRLMSGKLILCVLLTILLIAAAFRLLKSFLSEDREREKKWMGFEQHLTGTKH